MPLLPVGSWVTLPHRLSTFNKDSGRSANFLVADAVETYLADQELLRSDLRLADRQLKSGH
jgi:hypothetical protein